VVASNPKVYIKSHPRGYIGGVSTLHINLACESSSKKLANKYLLKAVVEMKRNIVNADGKVKKI